MSDEQRRAALAEAERTIERDGFVVCVCGATYLYAESYLEHRAICIHLKRARR